jgi:hypothetical protein
VKAEDPDLFLNKKPKREAGTLVYLPECNKKKQ